MPAADGVRTPLAERLRGLIDPATTAVVTMELQQGVVGEGVLLPALRDACIAAGTMHNAGRLCAAARMVGARVVHCTVTNRADGVGFTANSKVAALARKQRDAQGYWALEAGTVGVELMPELDVQPGDIEVTRIHGMTPFMSTSLDQILRNLGVTTLIATGVSVNIGIFGLTVNAIDLGYQTIVVSDAVAGVPVGYAQAVLDNSLSMLATIATTNDVLAAWSAS
jgi:biuret amidohydrolase